MAETGGIGSSPRWAGSSPSVVLATIVALIIFNLLVHGFNTGDHALLGDQPILAFVDREQRRHGASATAAAGTGRSATGRR